jgi:hypothetical protein
MLLYALYRFWKSHIFRGVLITRLWARQMKAFGSFPGRGKRPALVSVIHLCKNSHNRIGKYFSGKIIILLGYRRNHRKVSKYTKNKTNDVQSSLVSCILWKKNMAPRSVALYICTYETRKMCMTSKLGPEWRMSGAINSDPLTPLMVSELFKEGRQAWRQD